METARIFRHGGSQAVRLPKAYRFPGTEVTIEKRGDAIVLRPKRRPNVKTLNDVARHLAQLNPQLDFPAREQPSETQVRDLTW